MINDRSFSFSYERKFNLMAREENDSFQWYKRLEHLNYNGLILHSQNNMVFVPTKDKKKKIKCMKNACFSNIFDNHSQRNEQEKSKKC